MQLMGWELPIGSPTGPATTWIENRVEVALWVFWYAVLQEEWKMDAREPNQTKQNKQTKTTRMAVSYTKDVRHLTL